MIGLNVTPEKGSCVEDVVASSHGTLLHFWPLRGLVGIETFNVPAGGAIKDRSKGCVQWILAFALWVCMVDVTASFGLVRQNCAAHVWATILCCGRDFGS